MTREQFLMLGGCPHCWPPEGGTTATPDHRVIDPRPLAREDAPDPNPDDED